MQIFIDESGTFAVPRRNGPSISCAGALIIPDSQLEAVLSDFRELSKDWPTDKGEIKGRLLEENHFFDLVELLASRDVLFDCVAIDMGVHDERAVAFHRDRQADSVLRSVTDRHHPSMIEQTRRIASWIREQSAQQHAQFIAMNELIGAVMDTKLLYFAQACPKELGEFTWTIDAKGSSQTRSEYVWKTLVPHLLEARSYRRPNIHLVGADYSHFAKYENRLGPDEISRRRQFYGVEVGRQEEGSFDIGLVLRENLKFEDSRESLGLQLADVVVGLAARAMRKNIRRRAWWHLGKLMLRPMPPDEVIHLIAIQENCPTWTPTPPYYDVLNHLKRTARHPLTTDTLAAE